MKLYDYEKKHLEKIRAYAPECTVLLKKNGDFPLKEIGKIALYGSGARKTIKGGTGSGDVNARYYVTVEEGLKRAGFQITTTNWLDAYDLEWENARKRFIENIKRDARRQHTFAVLVGMGKVMPEPEYKLPISGEGDTAIYVVSRLSGEGNDRTIVPGDVFLTETEIRDILACQRKYKNFMLVLNVGGVIDLTPVAEVENILLLSQLGTVTGDTLADILIGKSYPSGKLTTTWSAWDDYAKIGSFGKKDITRYKEGIYVGYRYFDSIGKKPLYPFGHGLSYTEFQLMANKVVREEIRVTVNAKISNIGNFSGKEVVQLYVTAPWGELDQPYQKLIAFAKTKELIAGEEQEVELSFNLVDLASYHEKKASYVLEGGEYILRLGTSSQNTKPCAILFVEEEIVVRKLKHIGGVTNFVDWKPEHTWKDEIIEEIPKLRIDASMFRAITWPKYKKVSKKAKELVENLSDEEAVYLCIGNHTIGSELTSVIGCASKKVAGAAGESCDRIKGVPSIVMADGPAGLRLNQFYSKYKNKVYPMGASFPAGMSDFFPKIVNFMVSFGTKKKPKGKIYTQYCTAIPIGTALAQSWNVELCKGCGDIVGAEMERFGIQLWLAPALNIHRNILCGRNFEYYSEDPLVSGKIASALNQGVHRHKNCGTTIKHYCVNNQERNRYQSNSMVSERALREIYLKGFEICIRESNPYALMTSYNLLNGIHTSERADILKTVLQKEWGWNGLIMSDWVVLGMQNTTSRYPIAKAYKTIKAGNHLFMPGSSSNYKEVLNALKRGKLSRKEINACAVHVVETAWKLNRK